MTRKSLIGLVLLLCSALPAHAYLSVVRQGAESGDVPNADDHFGATVCTGDFDGDGLDDLATAAYDESNGLINTAVHGLVIINPGTSRGIGHLGTRVISVGDLGTEAARFGRSLAAADFNKDGYDDLAVGIPQLDNLGGPDRGAVWIYAGSASGLQLAPYLQISYDSIEVSPQDYANFGWALTSGDFNDDTYPDLCASAIGQDSNTGLLYFFYGSGTGITTTGFDKLYPYSVGGSQALGGYFGWSLASGQLDGLNGDDILVGAPKTDVLGQVDAGRAYFFYSAGAAGITGTNGWFVDNSNLGILDVDGDAELGFSVAVGHMYQVSGQEDVAIGAPYDDYGIFPEAGAVLVLEFDSQPYDYDSGKNMIQSSTFGGTSPSAGDHFGYSLAVGRYDIGNFEDLAIGAPGENVTEQAVLGEMTDAGTFHIMFGKPGGPGFGDAETYNSIDLNNFADNDRLGYSLAFGRFDATSREGLAIGAPYADYDSYESGGADVLDAGQVHIFAPWRQPAGGFPHRTSAALDCDGYLVFAQRPFQRHRPASTTKTVTLQLACDAIFDDGRDPNQFHTVPNWVATGPGGSQTPLVAQEQLTFLGLMQTMMTVSGNDSAMLIGTLLSGEGGPNWDGWSAQSPSFAADMEARLAGFGLSGATSMTNAAGIDSGDHYVTALDWARLAWLTIQDECVKTIVNTSPWIVERIQPAGTTLNFFQAPGDPGSGEVHVFQAFTAGWVDSVKGSYAKAVGTKPGGTPGGWKTGVSAADPFGGGHSAASSFGSRTDDAPIEGVVGQSSAPLNAALLQVAETFCDDGIPNDIAMPPVDPAPPLPWNTLAGIPPCPDQGPHGIAFNLGDDHAVEPGRSIQIDLMRHTLVDPSIPVKQMVARQSDVRIGRSQSVNFGIAPHQQNAGLEITNIGDGAADLQVVWGGGPQNVMIPSGGTVVIGGVVAPGASFTGQIVSTSGDVDLQVHELGYQFSLTLGDGSSLPDFHTVQLTRDGKILEESVSAYVRGFDDVCGGDTLDLVARADDGVTTGVGNTPMPPAPASFQLLPPQPNPFNPRTTIRFDLPRAAQVDVAVYDLRGRLVKTLAHHGFEAGRHDLQWDGTDQTGRTVASGVYLVRVESEGRSDSKRMTLIK